MKKHGREALREARKVAKAEGLDVAFVGVTSSDHYRFAVIDGERESLAALPCPKAPSARAI